LKIAVSIEVNIGDMSSNVEAGEAAESIEVTASGSADILAFKI